MAYSIETMPIGKSKISDMDFGSFENTIDKNIETDKASDKFDQQLQAYKDAGNSAVPITQLHFFNDNTYSLSCSFRYNYMFCGTMMRLRKQPACTL